MGITHVAATVRGPSGKEAHVRFLGDGGATYSLVSVEVSRELEPSRTVTTVRPDGSSVDRQVSECLFFLAEGRSHSPVVTRTLHPMRMLLA